VSYADVVGFTEISQRVSPSDLVGLLELVFGTIDSLANEYPRIMMLHTVGDAYVAVSGLVGTGVEREKQSTADRVSEMIRFSEGIVGRLKPMSYATSDGEEIDVKVRIGIANSYLMGGLVGSWNICFNIPYIVRCIAAIVCALYTVYTCWCK